MGWPRRRIASVLGGVCRLRHREFGGKRPYHFLAPQVAASGRWEIWADAAQAAIRAAQLDDGVACGLLAAQERAHAGEVLGVGATRLPGHQDAVAGEAREDVHVVVEDRLAGGRAVGLR